MRLFCSLLNYTSFPASSTRPLKMIIYLFSYFLRVWDCSIVTRAEALKPRRACSLGSVTLSKSHVLQGFHVYFCAKSIVGVNISTALLELQMKGTVKAQSMTYQQYIQRDVSFQFMPQLSSMGICICTKLRVFSNKTDYRTYLFKVLLHQIN